jgi:hypothetical protein
MARHRSTRVVVALGAMVLASVLVVPAALAARAVPDGYRTIPIKAAGLSIAIPDRWLRLDPKSPASAAALTAAAAKNPKLASLQSEFDQLKGSIKYWAVDSGAAEFADNLLVLPTTFDRAVVEQPDDVKSSLASSLGASAGPITVAKLKVDGVAALRADTTLNINTLDGTKTTAYATMFYVPTKKGVINLDYTSGTAPEANPRLAAMVKSIDIT